MEISKEEYLDLIKDGCFYCDRDLFRFTGHSLDKVDSDRGYVIGNVLPCCGDCNSLRMNILTVDETIEVVKLIRIIRGTLESPWDCQTRADEATLYFD
jgi:hypothetical protein